MRGTPRGGPRWTGVWNAGERSTRLDALDEHAVQIAVSRALLGDPQKFLRGAWTISDLATFGSIYF